MNIVSNLKEWQDIRASLKNKTIGFVPTMGYLHAGHISLCERSIQENDVTVVSIFVNPTQFNNASDLQHYPRDLSKDIATLAPYKVDYLFCPDAADIYSDHYQIQISETEISKELEGEYRPGHFTGMLTIVLKLFNLIQPTNAYFGEKDFQQLLLVKKMVQALFLPLQIVSVPTMRADDKLPLSSRNARLSPEQRQKAAIFSAFLHDFSLDCETIAKQLESLGFRIDYISEKWQRRLGAVWLDDIRLIDNIAIN